MTDEIDILPKRAVVRTVVERLLKRGVPPGAVSIMCKCSNAYAYRIARELDYQGKIPVFRVKRGRKSSKSADNGSK